MSSLSSIKGSLLQNFLLVSRNGTNYRKENRGKYDSLLPGGIKYDDLFLVSRNDVKYKIKWMDLYGVVPDSWQTTVNNTISGTFNTVVKDVFYKPHKFAFSSSGWTGTSDDFYVCHDGTYAYTSINNGATWTKIDGNNPGGNTSYSSIHPVSGGSWNQLYADPLYTSGVVFLVGSDGRIKVNDVQPDAYYKYSGNGYYYENKYYCAEWHEGYTVGSSDIFQIVGNGNRDFMYGTTGGYIGICTKGDFYESGYRVRFTRDNLFSSISSVLRPDMTALGYDYDDHYWLVGTSMGANNLSSWVGSVWWAQDPGNNVMPQSSNNDWSGVSLSMDNVTHIACGNGVWVAVGNGSGTIKIEISSSSSPNTWTNVTLPASMSSSTGAGVFKFDQYAKRFFLGLEDSQKFFHSQDGVIWTENSPTAGNTNRGIFGCTWVLKADHSAVACDFLVVGAGRQGHRTTITNDVKLLQDSDYMIMDRKEMNYGSKYYTYKFDGALWKSFVETDDTTY